MLSFAEEILLLALDDQQGVIKPLPVSAMEYALAGAVLMELAVLNRVDTDLQKLTVVNTEPTGDDLLDEVLQQLQEQKEPQTTTHWVSTLAAQAKDLQERVLERLVRKGVLKIANRKILWVFEVRRYPLMDNQEIKEVRTRLRELVMSNQIPDGREVILISLVNACRLFDEIFDEDELERLRPRIAALAKLDLIGQEVARSIREIAQAMALAMPMMI
ncbi:MAG: GPP34 family phosphoprotein [Kiritimatiellia bacterium]